MSTVVGREIREASQALGLTQAEVAERLGVSSSYISAVEAGRRNLTLGQLANIATAPVQVDAVFPKKTDFIEIFAHQGLLKSGQKRRPVKQRSASPISATQSRFSAPASPKLLPGQTS